MFDFALLIPLLAIFFIFGVPIMAVATHFVLRPMVRDVIGAIHGKTQAEAEVFRRQLEAGRRNAPGPSV